MNIRIRPGMTFYSLSNLFQTPLPLLLQANRDKNPNSLIIGEVIRIPGYYQEQYVINPGDTLWNISRQLGIPLERILLVNESVNPSMLRVGDVIRLPVKINQRTLQLDQLYTFERMEQDLFTLANLYPYITLRAIGQSVMGKPIYEVIIGKGDKNIHINGSFHANESITTSVIMKFLNDYLIALTNNETIRGVDMQQYFNNISLSLVPMVNPDGVNLLNSGLPEEPQYRDLVLQINNGSSNFKNWKANIRGVDLNNQYPANWEIEKQRKPKEPAPRDFPGYAPLTEPEAIALYNLVNNQHFDRVLALHTQGEVIYWGYQGKEPSRAEAIVKEYSRVSGYTPIRYVDSHAGFKDWFIQEYQRPGYTVELGRGVNPLPFSQFNDIYEETLGIFLANLNV
ncbi:M14 family metallopeptidase [Bacillaceae bacterium W0354]